MTTPFWVGTSWKMNKTLGEAADYCAALHDAELAALFIGRSAWRPEGLLAIAERVLAVRWAPA